LTGKDINQMAGVKGRSGGVRDGAGRPRTQHLTVVSPSVASKAKVPTVEGRPPSMPTGLTAPARKVWARLAPLAHTAATLTEATTSDFAATCELAVLASTAHTAVRAQKAGTPEWLACSRVYLAYARDLAVKLRAFRLAPNGLPMVSVEGQAKPKSALERLKERRQGMQVVGGKG
jgi:hypothetical protein